MRALLSAVVVLGAAAAPAHAARWHSSQVLDDGDPGAGQFAAAANDRGDAAYAWRGYRGMRVATARAGRSFGKPRMLGSGGRAQVSVSPRGDVAIAFQRFDGTYTPGAEDKLDPCCERLWVTVLRADGKLLRARPVTPKGLETSFPQHRPLLSWSRDGRRFAVAVSSAAHLSPGSVWLGAGDARRGLTTRHRISRRVRAVLAVSHRRSRPHVLVEGDDGDRPGMRLREIRPGARARTVLDTSQAEIVGVSDDGQGGQALLTLTRHGGEAARTVLRMGRRRLGGRFRMRALDGLRGRGSPFATAALGARRGRIVAAWARAGETRLRVRMARFGGRVRSRPAIDSPHVPGDLRAAEAALDPAGGGVLTWRSYRPSEGVSVWAVPLRDGRARGKPQMVYAPESAPPLTFLPPVGQISRETALAAGAPGTAFVGALHAGDVVVRRLR